MTFFLTASVGGGPQAKAGANTEPTGAFHWVNGEGENCAGTTPPHYWNIVLVNARRDRDREKGGWPAGVATYHPRARYANVGTREILTVSAREKFK